MNAVEQTRALNRIVKETLEPFRCNLREMRETMSKQEMDNVAYSSVCSIAYNMIKGFSQGGDEKDFKAHLAFITKGIEEVYNKTEETRNKQVIY